MAQAASSQIAAGIANHLSSSKYVHWTDEGVEPTLQNEGSAIDEMLNIIGRVQHHNFSMHRHAFRGTHVKTQAILKGTLTIDPNLPEELAHGIASPENAKIEHPVAIRFANEPSFLQDDRASGPRGAGLKIFNVRGSFLDPVGERTQTQDMTFNNAPLLELKDLPTCVDIFAIRERYFRDPDKIWREVGKRPDASLQTAPMGLPNQHFLSYVMYSQSAYRWGPYVAKYALFPTGKLQKGLKEMEIGEGSEPEQHSIWLREFFAENEATYELRVQLCQSLRQQPVEDASVAWDESAFPFRTVGKLVLPKQDSFSNERRKFWEDSMKLNVWYGLEEHRPLGSVNRLRKKLYQHSAANREKGNATKLVEIGSIDQIP